MREFSWVVTLIAACLAGLTLLVGLLTANGAPQQAAVGAIAVAMAIVPYVFTRAVEGLSARKDVADDLRHFQATTASGATVALKEIVNLVVGEDVARVAVHTAAGRIGTIEGDGARQISFLTEVLGPLRAAVSSSPGRDGRFLVAVRMPPG